MRDQQGAGGLSAWVTANGALVCDFCSAPTLARGLTLFACLDFERRLTAHGAELLYEICSCHTPIAIEPGDAVRTQQVLGGWLACRRCTKAIRANNRERLVRIAVASPHRSPSEMPTGMMEGGALSWVLVASHARGLTRQ